MSDFSKSCNSTRYCYTSSLLQVLIRFALKYTDLVFPSNLPTLNYTERHVALQGQSLMSIHSILQTNVPSTCLDCLNYPFSSKTLFFPCKSVLQPHHCFCRMYLLLVTSFPFCILPSSAYCTPAHVTSASSNTAPFWVGFHSSRPT